MLLSIAVCLSDSTLLSIVVLKMLETHNYLKMGMKEITSAFLMTPCMSDR